MFKRKEFVLLIRATGDSATSHGRRHTSIRFRTEDAAVNAAEFVRNVDPEAITQIVED